METDEHCQDFHSARRISLSRANRVKFFVCEGVSKPQSSIGPY